MTNQPAVKDGTDVPGIGWEEAEQPVAVGLQRIGAKLDDRLAAVRVERRAANDL